MKRTSLRDYFALLGSGTFFAAVLGLLLARELLGVLADLWLTCAIQGGALPERFLWIYGAFFAGAIAFSAALSFLLIRRALKAARVLHAAAVNRFLSDSIAHLRRIPYRDHLARLIHDQRVVDENAGQSLLDFFTAASGLAGVGALILCFLPRLAPAFVLLGLAYWGCARVYRREARHWAGAVGDASGRALAAAQDFAAGAVWLRASWTFDAWRVQRFEPELDHWETALFRADGLERRFSLRLELIGAAVFSAVCACAAWRVRTGAAFQASFGLALTYAAILTAGLGRSARMLTALDRDAVSVGKLLEHVPQAATAPRRLAVVEDGTLSFSDVSFAYPDSDGEAIRRVTFSARAGERVAVIGRTGSGKSTLTGLCLGLLRPSRGRVVIGGRSASDIPSCDIGRCVYMAPQHPVFLPGRLRDSIAPRRVHDNQVWAALDAVGLMSAVESLPGRLNFLVEPNARPPLSASRRRIFFLAGAVLSAAPIVILDEPTQDLSSCDARSLMARLFESLEGKTMIVVTHHWELASRFDRTIELEEGAHVLRLRG